MLNIYIKLYTHIGQIDSEVAAVELVHPRELPLHYNVESEIVT
jgi:hypothetical protein